MSIPPYFLILQVVFGVSLLAEALNFTNTPISDRSGLYYENVGEVRFTTTDWQLISYINVAQIESLRPRIPTDVLIHANNTCNTIQKNVEACMRLLGEKRLQEKDQQIQEYLNKFHAVINETSSAEQGNFNTVFSITGLAKETLFQSLTIDEAMDYSNEIRNFELKRKMNNTHVHYVETQLHSIHDSLNYYKKSSTQSAEVVKDFPNSAHPVEVSPLMVVIGINIWIRSLNEEFDNYINILRTIIEVAYLAKAGVIHPELFTTETVRDAMSQFLKKNPDQYMVFPIFNEPDRTSNKVLTMSKCNMGFYDGKLILALSIPLLDPTVYKLNKMYPYSVSQTFGNKQGSAYIKPRSDYLVATRRRYTFYNSEDLARCTNISGTYICKHKNPIYDAGLHPTCESIIAMQKRYQRGEIFQDCNIKISSSFNPQWTQISSGWLYSVLKMVELSIICQEKWGKKINISGVGVLQMKPGCYAQSSDMIIKGSETLFIQPVDNVSSEILNVTSLLPTSKYVNFIPSHYTRLISVQQKMKEMLSHDDEEDQQNSVIAVMLVGQLLLVFLLLLLPCTINAKPRNVQVLTIRHTPV